MLLFCVAALGQQRAGGHLSVTPSDLASDNQERVAASEAQIVAVLNDDPGLLVELKRWVAKDAADHGQVVEDTDLDDSAIFTRLSRDQKFRAVATRIVQRYGYLLPKLNPESDMGQEHDLLVKERVRLLAAQEERDQTSAATASPAGSAARATASCTANGPAECPDREQPGARQNQGAGRMLGPEEDYAPDFPERNDPGQFPSPAFPQGNSNGSLVDLQSPSQQGNGENFSVRGFDGQESLPPYASGNAGDRAVDGLGGGSGEDSEGIGRGADAIDLRPGPLSAQSNSEAAASRDPDQRTRAGQAALRL
jgi:hypothetical protein